MRIRQKLLLGFLFISSLTFGISFGISLVIQEKVGGIFQDVGGRILPGNIALSRVQTEFYHTLVLLDKYEADPDASIVKEIEQALASLGTHETTYDLFHSNQPFMSRIDQLVEKFNRLVARYMILLQKDGDKEESLIVRQKIDALLEQFGQSINPHIEQELAISYQKVADVQKMNEHFRWILLVAGVLIISFTLILSLYIAHLFSRPLRLLRDAAQPVGSGQLEIALPVKSQDEIGELAQAFNEMSESLNEMRIEEEHLGRALRRSQKMDAIGQLTGGIAHDFNNLLGIILGNLELLEQYLNADEKSLKRIKAIEKAGLRAANLTRQLLSFSRHEAKQISMVNINHVISEMTEIIKRSLTPEINIKYSITDNLWLTEIDAGDFEDTLVNLYLNARDSMQGHGNLTIKTQNVNLDKAYCEQCSGLIPGEYIEISISDTGEGIPSELKDRIFEPFFTTKDQGKGTGLGLAMVYAFVKRSNGYINCESEVGVGTTFHIYLPKKNSEQLTGKGNNNQSQELNHGKETILVVDDEDGKRDA